MCEYLININDADPVNAETAGVQLQALTLRSLAHDTLQTFLPAKSFTTAPLCATNDAVVVSRNGVNIFAGTADSAEFDFDAQGWRQTWRGAAEILERQNFFLTANAPVSPPIFDLGEPNWGINTRYEWGLIKEWCERSSNLVDGELQLASWPSSLILHAPDSSHLFSGSIMQNIRAVLGGYITACTRVDYTTTPPTLSIAHRGDDVVSVAAGDITGGSVRLRDDLWPTELRTRAVADSPGDLPSEIGLMLGNNRYSIDLSHYPFSPASTGRGTAINWLNQNTDTGIMVWSNIYEQAGYNVLRTPIWEGSVAMPLQSCFNSAARPGSSLNITSGVAAWATMQATVQEVRLDLIAENATLELGASAALDATSIISLMLTFARRKMGTLRTIPRALE
jgi:hypothetical protein